MAYIYIYTHLTLEHHHRCAMAYAKVEALISSSSQIISCTCGDALELGIKDCHQHITAFHWCRQYAKTFLPSLFLKQKMLNMDCCWYWPIYHPHLGEVDQALVSEVGGPLLDKGQISQVHSQVGYTGRVTAGGGTQTAARSGTTFTKVLWM